LEGALQFIEIRGVKRSNQEIESKFVVGLAIVIRHEEVLDDTKQPFKANFHTQFLLHFSLQCLVRRFEQFDTASWKRPERSLWFSLKEDTPFVEHDPSNAKAETYIACFKSGQWLPPHDYDVAQGTVFLPELLHVEV
jgi:hypothetical protein